MVKLYTHVYQTLSALFHICISSLHRFNLLHFEEFASALRSSLFLFWHRTPQHTVHYILYVCAVSTAFWSEVLRSRWVRACVRVYRDIQRVYTYIHIDIHTSTFIVYIPSKWNARAVSTFILYFTFFSTAVATIESHFPQSVHFK